MRNIDRDMERAATEAQATYYQCAAPGCTNGLRSDSQFYPACSQPCATMHGRTKSATSLRSALSIMGDVHMQQSIVDASWTTYKTGGRHWVRFRLGVQRRHPNQVVQGRFCRRTRLPVLEDDAEQQLIDFAEWLGLSGTAAPDTIEGYISAVKALHMIWCGHPYAAMSPLFFRLPKVIQGMKKSRAAVKTPPMLGVTRDHLITWFQQSGTVTDPI